MDLNEIGGNEMENEIPTPKQQRPTIKLNGLKLTIEIDSFEFSWE